MTIKFHVTPTSPSLCDVLNKIILIFVAEMLRLSLFISLTVVKKMLANEQENTIRLGTNDFTIGTISPILFNFYFLK